MIWFIVLRLFYLIYFVAFLSGSMYLRKRFSCCRACETFGFWKGNNPIAKSCSEEIRLLVAQQFSCFDFVSFAVHLCRHGARLAVSEIGIGN
mmetsp:Transcript_92861/g.189154  ORF Transcript_92861/g.189154 Transcript_92861/m.189154 type:complete len:92 (+) Transcript_92861:189-464(+)